MIYPFLTLGTIILFVPTLLSAPLTAIQKRDLPDYVLQYAPVAYLHSTEIYLPSDIASHLTHTRPENKSGTAITLPSSASPLTLSNLNELNTFGPNIYLTSKEGIEALPPWFRGTRPNSDGTLGSTTTASTIITVPKANNTLDAFYFYFYAYNQGNWVLGTPLLEFGDHVGDWEHTMIRFIQGVPQAMYFSQHAEGEAFAWSAVQKQTDRSSAGDDASRPIIYIANGTHANYATSGPHDHTIPDFNTLVGPLTDHTDAGVFWDPVPGALLYEFDTAGAGAEGGTFTTWDASPTAWLDFSGCWGDAQLPDASKGQLDVFGQRKYVAGPTGPRSKGLDRTNVCPDGHGCVVKSVLGP